MLYVQLFGSPLIRNASDSLTQFKSRKVGALLFYLAMTPGQHRRTYLADLLWSESSEEKALSNLRYALWNLRQVLGGNLLSSNRLNISFQQSNDIWIDVNIFRELLKPTDTNANAVTPELIARWQQAADLYRGEFLAGFEIDEAPGFENWLQQQRMAFHEMAINALSRLSAYYSSHHYLPEAIAATRRLLDLEPWQEAGHRQMMFLLAMAGQRDAALNYYQHCRQILAAELNLEPEPETTALMERIRAGQIKLAPEDHPTPLVSETNALSIPLFGRHIEYAWQDHFFL